MVQPRVTTDNFDSNAPFVGEFTSDSEYRLLQCGSNMVG